MVIYSNGTTIWGNGNPENESWEETLPSILEQGNLILDIGCGKYKVHDKCLGVDPYAEADGVNVQAYMWDLPFADDSVDGFFCFHALEHISKFQVMPALTEFSRVLKPNHYGLILVPDLEWVIRKFLENPNPNWELDMLYGIQTHEGEFHRTGFTKDILTLYLDETKELHPVTWYSISAYNQGNIGVLLKKGEGNG